MALYKYHYIELDTKRSPRISLQNIVAGETGNRLWITVTNNGETVDMSEKEDGEYIYRVCLVIKSNLGVRRQDSATEDSGIAFIDANTGDHGKVNILLSKDSFTAGKNRARLEIYSTRSEENDTLIVSAEWTFDVEGADEGDNVGLATPLLVQYEQQAEYFANLAEEAVQGGIVDPTVTEWLETKSNHIDGVIEDEVDDWLGEHPEATTTVQDGAVTLTKLHADLKSTTRNLNTLSVGNYRSVNGAPVATTSAYFGLSTYLPVSASTKYTATFYNITPAIGTIRASYYSSDKTYLSENHASSIGKLTFTTPLNCAYVHVWIYSSGGFTTSSDSHIQVELGDTSTDYVPPYSVKDLIAREGVANANAEITGLKSVDAALKDTQTQLLFNYIREKPFAHHIGVSQTSNIIIPAQSLFDIQRAKRLGFKVMELNVLETSDGKWICDHGFSGKWGAQFYSTDSTDISETLVSSMTLSEIKSKVRYNSTYAKYRVAPPTLEEALRECKRVGIVPLIQYKEGVIELADAIMGKGNYIASLYTTDRGTITDGMVSSWLTIADKDDLVAKCDASGGAYIAVLNVGNSAYSSFTLSDWEDLADALHAKGYLIGSAYTPQMLLPTLMKAGFDLFLSSCNTNRIENGNLCNLYGESEFSDFATTGTVADNTISLSTNQTITPAETMPTVFLGKGHLTIRFSGTIYVYLSKYFNNAYSFTSDGSDTLDISSFFEEEQATFTVRAAASTTVYEIIYKASEV